MKEKDNKLLERGRELLEIEEQRQVLEQQLLTSVSPFCFFPQNPHTKLPAAILRLVKLSRSLERLNVLMMML